MLAWTAIEEEQIGERIVVIYLGTNGAFRATTTGKADTLGDLVRREDGATVLVPVSSSKARLGAVALTRDELAQKLVNDLGFSIPDVARIMEAVDLAISKRDF